ncbi:hypothetical protein ACLB2K_054565 [Fragaria x ananassa]
MVIEVGHVRIGEKKKKRRKSIGGSSLGALDSFHLMAEGFLPSFFPLVRGSDVGGGEVDPAWWLSMVMLVLFYFHIWCWLWDHYQKFQLGRRKKIVALLKNFVA